MAPLLAQSSSNSGDRHGIPTYSDSATSASSSQCRSTKGTIRDRSVAFNGSAFQGRERDAACRARLRPGARTPGPGGAPGGNVTGRVGSEQAERRDHVVSCSAARPRPFGENGPVPPRPLSAIVLAAGEGTRMRSAIPKPLHRLCGRPMVLHVLDALAELADRTGRRRRRLPLGRRREGRPGRGAPGAARSSSSSSPSRSGRATPPRSRSPASTRAPTSRTVTS